MTILRLSIHRGKKTGSICQSDEMHSSRVVEVHWWPSCMQVNVRLDVLVEGADDRGDDAVRLEEEERD